MRAAHIGPSSIEEGNRGKIPVLRPRKGPGKIILMQVAFIHALVCTFVLRIYSFIKPLLYGNSKATNCQVNDSSDTFAMHFIISNAK